MIKKDIYEQSKDLHKKLEGKISTESKFKIKNKKDLALAYTPGVGRISEEIGKNKELRYQYTIKKNTVAIVSDGSAILGLGNLGPDAAMPVMEGKAMLFKDFGGINAFPLCLDTQDTEEIINIVKNIAPAFGGINLEDISAPRCFEIEERLRKELDIPVMHDDQHGTAMVVLAGLINALKLRGSKIEDVKIVISGAGAAGIAITKILLNDGFKHVVVSDSVGAIYKNRENLNSAKEKLADSTNLSCHIDIDDPKCAVGNLKQILKGADIFIGVSRGNLLTKEDIQTMNKNPIVFALSNPVPEIMPDEAKAGGAFIVATGRSDFPNQLNNVLAFPGAFKGALENRIKQFKEEMFVKAAKNLANLVKNPSPENILPDVFDKKVVEAVSKAFVD